MLVLGFPLAAVPLVLVKEYWVLEVLEVLEVRGFVEAAESEALASASALGAW